MKLKSIFVADRIDFIRTYCKNKSVLNLGCGDVTRLETALLNSEHLHHAVAQVSARLVGVDINRQALELLQQTTGLKEFVCHDVERIAEIAGSLGTFDIVLAGELIEHLSNPGLMLDGIKRLIREESILILTTPSALSLRFFLHTTLRRIDVSSDYHTLMFPFKVLTTLLGHHGYEACVWAVSQWYHQGVRNIIARRPFALLFRLLPQIADTILCVARPTAMANNHERRQID